VCYKNYHFIILNFAAKQIMESFSKKCFVCKKNITKSTSQLNTEVNLPVCSACKGTPRENEMVQEYLDELADGLVCGCI
jgi:uncharacterized protein YjaZ